MSDNAGFPLPSPPFPPGCYEQQPTGTGVSADAFANGYLQAKKRFERIEELSTQRERLVGGDSAPQGISAEALKKMLDELDATITSYQTTFFLGTKDSESWTANLEYRPGKSIVSTSYNTFQTSPVLLTFSKEDGVCETPESKLQGVIIHPDFVAARCPLTPANEQVAWLSLKRVISDDPYLGHMEAANLRDEQAGERGFYYRIPAKAIVTLEVGQIAAANQVILAAQSLQGQNWRINVLNAPAPAGPFFWPAGREVGRETMRVAQIGVVASIPASAAGRKTQYTIDFEESTGALRNFKLASNALLEKGLVDEIGGSAKDILAAKQARAKAKAEANDELAKKKRELELLQTDNLIDAEKKKKANSQP